MAEILPEELALEAACRLLEAGELVAIPTETVYGLAADATNGDAVARIFEVKGRPRFNPLIAHVADRKMAERIAIFSPLAARLADSFWPGPLTLVLPQGEGSSVHPLVTAGLDTVAVRCPKGFGRALTAQLGRPVAAPSANLSGRITPTTAEAVNASIGERIRLVVDGGPALVGVESTIVKVAGDSLVLLRPGGVASSEVEKVAGLALQREVKGVEAPGMLSSHYAPDAQMRLDIDTVEDGEALLAFGPNRAGNAQKAVMMLNLSPKGDLREAAANLFSYLSTLDATGATTIAVEPVPRQGLGEAINDRLSRAAAPRDTLRGKD
ncbi:L-threonylcarbamoyladenylate synthase [Chelativorans sp. Marseille-P2723]|uniref:L-threonylcarbamoyladenylate synthase n=1 Tax=Chelativorans sp. Marseille-P2723 TaxID=2709133 RepID=UPI00156E7370|nr:L-threonylcarbamoyladenylate synthase [Chelativorans sp. Marseille-P2723]